MTPRAARWAIAIAASVLAHLAMAAVLALTLAPSPVPPQPAPASRFDLSAQPVEQVAAVPRPTEGIPAQEGRAEGAALPPGTVPLGRAAPVAPTGTPLAPMTAAPDALPGRAPPAAKLEGTAPAGTSAAAAAPPAAALAALPAEAETARPSAPVPRPAPALAMPEAPALEDSAAPAPRLAATTPETAPAPAAEPRAESLAAADLPEAGATVAPLPQIAAAATAAEAPRLAAAETDAQVLAGATADAAAAQSIAAAADRLASTTAEATGLDAVAPAAETARPAPAEAERLAGATAAAQPLAGAVPETETAAAGAPPAQELPATAGEAPTLFAAMPDAAPHPVVAPPAGISLAGSPPGDLALVAAAAPAIGARAQAALAWTGADADQIDPVSLAAIQSFMQPADLARLAPGADPVRDGISALLASVPCARMQTVFLPETGALELRGHVPEEGLRDPVLGALRGQVGGAIPVTDNLRVLPRPQCDVLAGIAALGLPQSTVQETDPRLVGPDAHAREYHYLDGETLTFEVTTPDYPAHVYIDYFDAAGMVLHLQPNEMLDTALMEPKSTLRVGTAPDGTEVFTIAVAPPFGNEIAVAFAASTPIHDTPRPVREPAGPYLDWLQDRIARARAADPDFKGEWVYFFMTTAPRTQ